MEFVDGGLVQEGSLVEEVVADITVVGYSSLDLGVSERSQGDIERRSSLVEIDDSAAGSSCQSNELRKSDLHDEEMVARAMIVSEVVVGMRWDGMA